MIYTLTLNPALDYVIKTDSFCAGKLNRSGGESIFAGGKGINVSRILKTLGVDSVAMGFASGFTGIALVDAVEKMGIKTDFIMLKDGLTRINVKIKADCETELNGKGPLIDETAKEELFLRLKELNSGDVLIMSGSRANGLDDEIYSDIMKLFPEKNIRFIVDAEGSLLRHTLPLNPWLIKPNKEELEDLFGLKIKSVDDAVECAKKLCADGAQNVLATLGSKGAVFVSKNGDAFRIYPLLGKSVTTVGAGDSAVAGFLMGFDIDENIETALRYSIAAGAATAFSEDLASKEEIMKNIEKVKIEKLF